MKVGILLTTFNKEKTIEKSLDSAINQNYDKKLIVVVDDGSKDKTWEILRDRVKNKDRYEPNLLVGSTKEKVPICIYRLEKNIGVGEAKNIGVGLCSKEVDSFMFLDADDELNTEKVSKSVRIMLEDPKAIGIIYSDQYIINEINNFTIKHYVPSFSRFELEKVNYIEPNCLVNKEALIQSGKFYQHVKFPEHLMWLRITERYIAIHIPEFLSIHRITQDGLTNTTSQEERENDFKKYMTVYTLGK